MGERYDIFTEKGYFSRQFLKFIHSAKGPVDFLSRAASLSAGNHLGQTDEVVLTFLVGQQYI